MAFELPLSVPAHGGMPRGRARTDPNGGRASVAPRSARNSPLSVALHCHMVRALVLGAIFALLVAPSAAALVVFQRPASRAIVAVHDDGTRARVLAHGYLPTVAPNGRRVVYLGGHDGPTTGSARTVSTRGGPSRLLLRDAFASGSAAGFWSPNSRYVVVGGPNGTGARLVDVAHRRRRIVALSDDFGGAAFSPDSRIALIVDSPINGGNTVLELGIGQRRLRQLASGTLPVWGRGGLAYEQDDGGKYDAATYSQVVLAHRLGGPTRTLIRSTPGLSPVGWSADGTRLLAAQTTATGLAPLLLSPTTGASQTLPVALSAVDALSRDGRRVLGQLDGNVVTEGLDGKIKILAHHATNPSWTQ